MYSDSLLTFWPLQKPSNVWSVWFVLCVCANRHVPVRFDQSLNVSRVPEGSSHTDNNVAFMEDKRVD